MNAKKYESCERCPAHARSAFGGLPPASCAKVDDCREPRKVFKGDKIQVEVDREPGFFCLGAGHWKVSLQSSENKKTVRIAGPGDLVCVGTWTTGTKKLIAEALDDGEACFFPKSAYEGTLANDPEVMKKFIVALWRVIHIKDERISSLASTSAKARVAGMLLSLAEKFGSRQGQGIRIDTAVDRRTMATLAGTVPETLARILTDLEESRIIAPEGRAISILDEAELAKCQ